MQKYLSRSLIQAAAIGVGIFLLDLLFAGKDHVQQLSPVGSGYISAVIWCVIAIFIAIVVLDKLNGKRPFNRS